MKTLTLILAETPLEPVPRELWSHPSVYRHARRRGKPPRAILLDAAMHHQAMKRLPGREHRGRPDIAHVTLLTVLDSPLCRKDMCRILVHTASDYLIEVDPATRLPRNYLRFTGLMEQLFEEGAVPPRSERPLLALTRESLTGLIEKYHPLALLPGHGREASLTTITHLAASRAAILLPTTPRATPTPRLLDAAARGELEAYNARGLEDVEPWTLASRLLCRIEAATSLI